MSGIGSGVRRRAFAGHETEKAKRWRMKKTKLPFLRDRRLPRSSTFLLSHVLSPPLFLSAFEQPPPTNNNSTTSRSGPSRRTGACFRRTTRRRRWTTEGERNEPLFSFFFDGIDPPIAMLISFPSVVHRSHPPLFTSVSFPRQTQQDCYRRALLRRRRAGACSITGTFSEAEEKTSAVSGGERSLLLFLNLFFSLPAPPPPHSTHAPLPLLPLSPSFPSPPPPGQNVALRAGKVKKRSNYVFIF